MEPRRKQILERIGVVSGRLEKLLSGQDVTLKDIPLPQEAEPGEDPVTRLRRALALLNGLLGRLDDGSYGRCTVCGREIPGAELDELPWATLCRECGAANPGASRGKGLVFDR